MTVQTEIDSTAKSVTRCSATAGGRPKIGILQTGTTPDEIRQRHGDYDDLFRALLDGHGLDFETYRVLDGVLPDSANAADGWLITGSKYGVYEDHDWIPPLEAFLRAAYAAAVPIVGICFGHQILAQALGGKVERFEGGWAVGASVYETADGEQERMMAWHRDQVVVRPAEAVVVGESRFCANAMLAYGDRALTFQAHPEFTRAFLADLLLARRGVLPEDIAVQACDRMDMPLTSPRVASQIAAFFTKPR